MAKRNELTEQTKKNIMDAFWQLYCDRRIEKITVKDIASKAGYNRSTFYEYFTDPYDVLEQLEASLIPNLETLPPMTGLPVAMGMPGDLFMDLYESNSAYYSVLLGPNGDPGFSGKLKACIKPLLLGLFKDKSVEEQQEMDYIFEYTLTAMIGMMSYWFSQPKPMPKSKLYELMQSLMAEGVMKRLKVEP